MKTLNRILAVSAIILLTMTGIKAQTIYASLGIYHDRYIPRDVIHVIDDHNHGYEWIHTRRVYHHDHLYYDPFHRHTCDRFCGFHSVRYRDHYHHAYVKHHPPGKAYGHYKNKHKHKKHHKKHKVVHYHDADYRDYGHEDDRHYRSGRGSDRRPERRDRYYTQVNRRDHRRGH